MNGKTRAIIASILGSFVILSAFYVKSPADENRGARYTLNKLLGRKSPGYRQQVFSRKLTDKMPDYIATSSRTGIKACNDRKELLKQVSRKKLSRIRERRGYRIDDLNHSYPFLTPGAKTLLVEMGKRFREKTAPTALARSDFMVSSMTRTTTSVKRLKKANTNASGNSPHFHGNAFDVSYVRFSSGKCFLADSDKYFLKEALAEVIWQLREEKRCWATYEIKQGCFHVVVR